MSRVASDSQSTLVTVLLIGTAYQVNCYSQKASELCKVSPFLFKVSTTELIFAIAEVGQNIGNGSIWESQKSEKAKRSGAHPQRVRNFFSDPPFLERGGKTLSSAKPRS